MDKRMPILEQSRNYLCIHNYFYWCGIGQRFIQMPYVNEKYLLLIAWKQGCEFILENKEYIAFFSVSLLVVLYVNGCGNQLHCNLEL